jgi:hypothetical protein
LASHLEKVRSVERNERKDFQRTMTKQSRWSQLLSFGRLKENIGAPDEVRQSVSRSAQILEGRSFYQSIEAAQADGAITINYGRFCQQIINFLFVGLSVYGFYRGMQPAQWHIHMSTREDLTKC